MTRYDRKIDWLLDTHFESRVLDRGRVTIEWNFRALTSDPLAYHGMIGTGRRPMQARPARLALIDEPAEIVIAAILATAGVKL